MMVLRVMFEFHVLAFICALVQNVQGLHSFAKQDRLNAVIAETIAQNIYLFPSTANSTSTRPQGQPRSRVRSLCSDLKSNDPDRNRVGCCQHSKMKILYNVQLHNGYLEAMYEFANSTLSGDGVHLPVLNALR